MTVEALRRGEPQVLAELLVNDADGDPETIADNLWQAANTDTP